MELQAGGYFVLGEDLAHGGEHRASLDQVATELTQDADELLSALDGVYASDLSLQCIGRFV